MLSTKIEEVRKSEEAEPKKKSFDPVRERDEVRRRERQETVDPLKKARSFRSSMEIEEVREPGEVKPEKRSFDLVRDGAQQREMYETVAPLKDEIIKAIVKAVVNKAKSALPTNGVATEVVQKSRDRIEKAGEIWGGELVKRVASRGKEPANSFGGGLQEVNSQESRDSLQATREYYQSYQKRILRPMKDTTKGAKMVAVQQLEGAYRELEEEAKPLIERYNSIDVTETYGNVDAKNVKAYIDKKIGDLRTLQTDLDSLPMEKVNGPVALLGWHIQRSHDSAGMPAEQSEHGDIRGRIKTELDKDVSFWEKAGKLHEMVSGEYSDKIEEIDKYLNNTINGPKDQVEELRYSYHDITKKIEREVSEAGKLTRDKTKEEFIDGIVGLRPSDLEATLFKEMIQRHDAKNSARARAGEEPDRIQEGLWVKYFDSDIWRTDLMWEKNDQRYKFGAVDGGCAPACLTRIVSFYDHTIRSSQKRLRGKFEEIAAVHTRGKFRKELGWSFNETRDYLNTELKKGRLTIPMSKGKEVRFELRENFSYAELDSFMHVKDRDGNYIPIITGVYSHKENPNDEPGHSIVLHRQRDHSGQGNQDLDFVVYDPYLPVRPAHKYALGRIWDQSHWQEQYDGSKRVYVSGYMGPNYAVVPVVCDSEKPSGGLDSRAVLSKLLR